MYPYYQTLGYKAAETRRAELLDAIRDYRYLAAHKLAADDLRERAIAEAARSRLLAANGVVPGWRPAIAEMRQRLGAVLVGVGSRLQGASPSVTVADAAIDTLPAN